MLSGACQTIGVASVTNMTRKSRSTTFSLFQCCVRRWMPNIFAPLYDCTCSLSSRVHPTSMVQSYNSVMVNVCVSIESMPSILSAAAKNGSSPGTASSPGNESAANWMMNFQSKHPPQTILWIFSKPSMDFRVGRNVSLNSVLTSTREALSESLDHFPRHSRQTDVNSTPVPKDIVVCDGGGKKKNRAKCCKMWPQLLSSMPPILSVK